MIMEDQKKEMIVISKKNEGGIGNFFLLFQQFQKSKRAVISDSPLYLLTH